MKDEILNDLGSIMEARELRDRVVKELLPRATILTGRIILAKLTGNTNPDGSLLILKDSEIPNWKGCVSGVKTSTLEKLKLLDGPNGYAIFKAMQAKQGVKDNA